MGLHFSGVLWMRGDRRSLFSDTASFNRHSNKCSREGNLHGTNSRGFSMGSNVPVAQRQGDYISPRKY